MSSGSHWWLKNGHQQIFYFSLLLIESEMYVDVIYVKYIVDKGSMRCD